MSGLMIEIREDVGLDSVEDIKGFFEREIRDKIPDLLPEGVSMTGWVSNVFGDWFPLRYFVIYFNKTPDGLFEKVGSELKRDHHEIDRFDST